MKRKDARLQHFQRAAACLHPVGVRRCFKWRDVLGNLRVPHMRQVWPLRNFACGHLLQQHSSPFTCMLTSGLCLPYQTLCCSKLCGLHAHASAILRQWVAWKVLHPLLSQCTPFRQQGCIRCTSLIFCNMFFNSCWRPVYTRCNRDAAETRTYRWKFHGSTICGRFPF